MNHLEVQIGGADKEKAKIIMRKINRAIAHTSPLLLDSLRGKDTFERVRTSISKNTLQWLDSGSIDIFTLSERLKQADVEGAGGIGLGGDVIVIEESALVSDENYSVARRMIVESQSGKFVEISNPHLPNHFKQTYEDPDFFHVHAGEDVALEEGRFTRSRLDKAKRGMTERQIRIFFHSLFPEDTAENPFFEKKLLNKAQALNLLLPEGIGAIGIDAARGGGDLTVLTVGYAQGNKVKVEEEIVKNTKDTMEIVNLTKRLTENYNGIRYVAVDTVGLGAGIYDRLRELIKTNVLKNVNCFEFVAGASPTTPQLRQRCANLKTQVALYAMENMREGNIDLSQASTYTIMDLSKYEEDGTTGKTKLVDPDNIGTIRIENKVLKRKSPDFGDSFLIMLYTFMNLVKASSLF